MLANASLCAGNNIPDTLSARKNLGFLSASILIKKLTSFIGNSLFRPQLQTSFDKVDHQLFHRNQEHRLTEYQQCYAYLKQYLYDSFRRFPIFIYRIHLPIQHQNQPFQSLNQVRQHQQKMTQLSYTNIFSIS
jgi:hypothetical protein